MVSRRQGRRWAGAVACRVRAALGNTAEAAASASAPGMAPAPVSARPALEPLEGRMLMAADFLISEFMASNKNTLADRFGGNSDWIEIHNRGDAAGSLNGYYLTDDSNNLTQWRFPDVSVPAGGYALVFASGQNLATAGQELHTNFNLDSDGEYLALVAPDGFTVQHAYAPSFPSQTADISYGPTNENDPASGLQFFTTPSPGAANIANAPAPVFSIDSRTFASPLSLALTLPAGSPAGAEIHYTIDRSLPTAASPKYTSPITISNSTVVRALVTAPGRTPSPVVSKSYVALDASVQSFNSNLPVVIMDSFGSGFNDTTLTPVSAYFIDTAASDGRAEMLDAPDFAGRGGMRLRGQSSQTFPQPPYAFETWDEVNGDKDVSILGMPKESDWILYNPYSEKSLMQNSLVYEWANRMGQYAVRTRYVELFVNTSTGGKIDYGGDYRGVYIFMEKIKVDDDRLDIAKLEPGDNAAPEITGGYVWKNDKDDTGERLVNAGGYSWNFHEPGPEEITAAQETYLKNYINAAAAAINGPNFKDPVNGYAKYIDVDSWIDHHIMVELTKNIDGFRISTYYHKDRDGKIKMGPVWDYNLSLGNADYNNGGDPTGWYHDLLGDIDYRYFRRLFQDPAFAQRYQDRWQELRQDVLSTPRLMADIDELTTLLSDGNGNYPVGNNPPQAPNNPVVRHYKKWQHLAVDTWPNFYVNPSWINHVNWMKDWLQKRLTWWDNLYVPVPTIAPGGGPVTSPTQVNITSRAGVTLTDTALLASGAPAKALVPTSDIGSAWRTQVSGFNESGWLSGTTGVGYDDDPNNGGNYLPFMGLNVTAPPDAQTPTPMRNTAGSLYARVPFTLPAGVNPATIQSLILKMRYDDGFVAYLNGTEIARSANGIPDNVAFDSSGGTSHDAAGVEEFDVTQFRNLLQPGANLLAIQGINTTLGSSDLLEVPELVARSSTATPAPVYYTTDGSDPRLPAGGVSPTARLYTGPFTVSNTTRVRARSLLNNQWSGLADELYDFGESRLRVTELMYHPAPPLPTSTYLPGDFEYVELQNTGSAPLDLTGVNFDKGITFTFGARTLAPGERVLVVKDQAAFESRYGTDLRPLIAGTFTGSLSDGGERVQLRGRLGEVIQNFSYSDDWYKQSDGEGYSLTIIDPAGPLTAWDDKTGWRASEPFGGTPGTTDAGVRPNSIVINEVLSNPQAADNFGDWIELRNTTNSPVDIGGWWLSDTASNLKKWQIPAGTAVPANGYFVFTEKQDFNAAFGLNPAGEGVYLSSGNTATGALGGYRVDETFGASDVGATFGRFVKSTGGADFTALASATKGAANAAAAVGPVVINEIMYAPAAGKSEYVELRNITGSDVPLYLAGSPSVTWRLSGGIDFALPGGATIPANGYAIISAVDPATFRQQYPDVPAGVPVWGPYTLANGVNVLSDNGENIRLQRPQVTSATPRPYVDVDHVGYDDDAPWPADTKGTGQSLGRLDSAAYGNDPVNWDSERSNGSPGRSNFTTDFVAPTADVVDVTPDPRTTAVDAVTIAFSERVVGFDLSDLRLTRDGTEVILGDAISLTTSDNGTTWTLRGLAPFTVPTGDYAVTLIAAGSGVRDTASNSLAVDAADAWRMNNPDASAPTVNIVDVSPDPRRTGVPTISITFSETITGFDASDLTLTRDGGPNLLPANQALSSTDGGKAWSLSGLNNLTAPAGTYLLTLKSSGTGITDFVGNALAGGATDQWVVDVTVPTVQVDEVAPNPRNSPVDQFTFNFNEPVLGFEIYDLQLTRDGGANMLGIEQTLSSTDGGRTWTLNNLAPLTGDAGAYSLTLFDFAAIRDAAGNVIPRGLTQTWTTDTTVPTADVTDVTPDPRPGAVDSAVITFSEPVVGVDLADVQLIRQAADGSVSNVLTAAQTLTSADGGVTWVLGNLAGITAAPGTYTLTLVSGVAGISDAAGNSLAGDASDTWQVTGPTFVAGRHVFYNRSIYDGNSAAADPADDGAIATDKQALLPGQAAGVANYTGFAQGLNGIMIDVSGLPSGLAAALSAADFAFKVGPGGNPAGWAAAPAPSSVSVRRGAGVGGSDRITITFPDGAIRNQWLQVTTNANANTGIAQPDVFYFGNLVGETGDNSTTAAVNALDLAAVKRALNTASDITGRFDFDRSGRVNALDLASVKQNMNRSLGAITTSAPAVFSQSAIAPASLSADVTSAAVKTDRVWSESQPDLLA